MSSDRKQGLDHEPESEKPILYEEAQAIWEADMAETNRVFGLKDSPEDIRPSRIHRLAFTMLELSARGETRPVSIVHADQGFGEIGSIQPRVAMPLNSWRELFLLSLAARAGIKLPGFND